MTPALRLIAASAVLFVAPLRADEPAVELPAEGAWVRYHVLTKPDNGPEAVLKTTLKFLGRRDHDGTPCRVIEIAEHHENGPLQAHRYLVPEEALRKSSMPLMETVAASFRTDGGVIQPERLGLGNNFHAYLLFLPAARTEAKPIAEPQTVDMQQERLVIPTGHRGEFRWSREAITVKQTQAWAWEYTVWPDPKLPVGIARGRFQFRFERDGEVVRRFTQDLFVEDFGLDAKSGFEE